MNALEHAACCKMDFRGSHDVTVIARALARNPRANDPAPISTAAVPRRSRDISDAPRPVDRRSCSVRVAAGDDMLKSKSVPTSTISSRRNAPLRPGPSIRAWAPPQF